jgi:hypothetical protein
MEDLIQRIEMLQLVGFRRLGLTDEQIANITAIDEKSLRAQGSDEFHAGITARGRQDEQDRWIRSIVGLKVPTRFQNPGSYRLILDLWRALSTEEIVQKNAALSPPLLATAWTGTVNALVFPGKNDDTAIVFDESIFHFAHLLSKLVANLLYWGIEQDNFILGLGANSLARKSTDEAIYQRFSELFISYLTKGSPTAAPRYIPPKELDPLIISIRDGFEIFVLGHVLGHVYCGHFSDPRLKFQADEKTLLSTVEGGDQPMWRYRHQKELEADDHGLRTVLKFCFSEAQGSPRNLQFYYLGALLFFVGLEMFERMKCLLQYGEDWWDDFPTADLSDIPNTVIDEARSQFSWAFARWETATGPSTHPSPILRRQSLRNIFAGLNIPVEFSLPALMLERNVYVVMTKLLRRIRPTIEEMRKEKTQIHPLWRANPTAFTSKPS